MYILRRTAARAISSSPSKAFFAKPRSTTTYTPPFAARQAQWAPSTFQRRFATDNAVKEEIKGETAAPASEEIAQAEPAQTIPEAPVEEHLTPAQESVISGPQDGSRTVTGDALRNVERSQNRSLPRAAPSDATPNSIIYVGNLYYEVKEEQLQNIFSRFGDIKSIRIVRDPRGLSRGFGYVEYENVDDASAAIENLNLQVFEGRSLVVQYHKQKANFAAREKKGPSKPTSTLFIGNMSFEMSDKDLNEMFKDLKNVVDVRVAIDRRTGVPRGFAHADFVDVASAQKAMEVLNGKTYYGRSLRIDYSSSTPRKYERNQENQEKHENKE